MPAYNWSGFYIGGNVGYGWGDVECDHISAMAVSGKPDGCFGGGQIGWNWQAPGSPWVWGVEVDSQWAEHREDSSDRRLAGGVVANAFSRLDYFGTARLRLGYAWDRVMFYGTGGLAWGTNEIGGSVDAPGLSLRPVSARPTLMSAGRSAPASNGRCSTTGRPRSNTCIVNLGNENYFGGTGLVAASTPT